MERVLYQLRCSPLQVKEDLTSNGLNNRCLLSHITAALRQVVSGLSTQQNSSAVENLSFPSVPLASPSILALSHDDCKMAASAPDITSSYNSIEGRRNFFLPERKKFSKTHHPGLFPFDLLSQNLVSHCPLPPPLSDNHW